MKTDIILAGVGGQGILSVATILGAAALKEGLYIKQSEVHGMSQRGGEVQSNLRISSEKISSDLIPTGAADLIVSLEPMEALRYLKYLKPDGWVITSTAPFVNIDNYPDEALVMRHLEDSGNVVAFDMDELARQLAAPRSGNMALLGAASPFIDISPDKIERAISSVFSSKGEKIVADNIKAFRTAREKSLQIAGM
ncbi:MAG: indolepyruvate oxidoreductase subunit beta [Muribaculaceae bacterium]|nr:indolepyruvate oxidoreductase subunit beta [Muribaculaceae bacterium]